MSTYRTLEATSSHSSTRSSDASPSAALSSSPFVQLLQRPFILFLRFCLSSPLVLSDIVTHPPAVPATNARPARFDLKSRIRRH